VATPHLAVEGATEVTPNAPPGAGLDDAAWVRLQRRMLDELWSTQRISAPILWYYTPMALPFSRHLPSPAVVYDCMDALSQFKGAPPTLLRNEAELLRRADVVFTGGVSLYEAMRARHSNIYAFPSSVDVGHFARARGTRSDPADQSLIPHPRLGFFGVIDERLNLEMIAGVARSRPDWQLVLVGPVVKITPESLPRGSNIHYLGGKKYDELPDYLGGWDVALMPFALNESTRFISPTKTPEYLAAGKPVVSTSIRDVVRPYRDKGLVKIADTPEAFVQAVEESLALDRAAWLPRVDAHLAHTSWDETWRGMKGQIDAAMREHPGRQSAELEAARA
ncbi:MAG TPA: glycosyltransferase, partial [Myxococcaceae bacterium]|nr:glycosyltransferase [Myxococcaceae bacterium]